MAKILIVDDDPLLRELLGELLELEGHATVAVESGMEGLAKLREGGFQLVTLDVEMPLLSGIEVLKLIRRDPTLVKLPVLMVTGQSMMAELDAAFGDGATGYILKPFDLLALSASVTKALSGPL